MKFSLPRMPVVCDGCGSLRFFGQECRYCDCENKMPEPNSDVVRTSHIGYGGLIHESDVETARRLDDD
jgi:hypothetical protein